MGRSVLLAVAIVFFSIESISVATDKVVCYHGSWSTYRSGNGKFTVGNIDPSLCTHLIYSFVGINADGTIHILDQNLEISRGNLVNFNALKQQNPNLKTLVAIGGWNEGSTTFSSVARSPSLRAVFIQNALNFVQTYGFNGFDLDWEYPAQRGGATTDKANFVSLIKEFRAVFDKYGLLLTAAVAAPSSLADISYDIPSLSQYLDVINVMTYDLHGSWEGVTGQNAPLYASSIDTTAAAKLLNVDAVIQAWIKKGANPQKLALGLGFYGRSYTLSDSSNTALGAPISAVGVAGSYTLEAGMLGYNEICEQQLKGGWTTVWDDKQKVPYSYKGNQWVGYDNAKSITAKVNYAKSLNLSGVMVWSIETDDFRGICGTKYPLLNAIKTALGKSNNNAASTDDKTVDTNTVTVNKTTTSNSTTTKNETTSTADKTDSSDSSTLCTTTGYVRDPTDCTVFYYCLLSGTTYVPLTQKCSSGLYFDEKAQTCNWPDLVTGC